MLLGLLVALGMLSAARSSSLADQTGSLVQALDNRGLTQESIGLLIAQGFGRAQDCDPVPHLDATLLPPGKASGQDLGECRYRP